MTATLVFNQLELHCGRGQLYVFSSNQFLFLYKPIFCLSVMFNNSLSNYKRTSVQTSAHHVIPTISFILKLPSVKGISSCVWFVWFECWIKPRSIMVLGTPVGDLVLRSKFFVVVALQSQGKLTLNIKRDHKAFFILFFKYVVSRGKIYWY